MTPPNDVSLDTIHATATGIFTGALTACNIATAFDRRLRFEGNRLQRLMPDGSGPATIDLNAYKRVFVIAIGKAAIPMLDTLQGSARHLLYRPNPAETQLALPVL
jgi:hydroxypyruvate reductase